MMNTFTGHRLLYLCLSAKYWNQLWYTDLLVLSWNLKLPCLKPFYCSSQDSKDRCLSDFWSRFRLSDLCIVSSIGLI